MTPNGTLKEYAQLFKRDPEENTITCVAQVSKGTCLGFRRGMKLSFERARKDGSD